MEIKEAAADTVDAAPIDPGPHQEWREAVLKAGKDLKLAIPEGDLLKIAVEADYMKLRQPRAPETAYLCYCWIRERNPNITTPIQPGEWEGFVRQVGPETAKKLHIAWIGLQSQQVARANQVPEPPQRLEFATHETAAKTMLFISDGNVHLGPDPVALGKQAVGSFRWDRVPAKLPAWARILPKGTRLSSLKLDFWGDGTELPLHFVEVLDGPEAGVRGWIAERELINAR
jgi:hypothetical protein